MSKTYEIEYSADTQGQADDLLRQACNEVLYASQAGRLGYLYTGSGEQVFALRDLLVARDIEHLVTAR